MGHERARGAERQLGVDDGSQHQAPAPLEHAHALRRRAGLAAEVDNGVHAPCAAPQGAGGADEPTMNLDAQRLESVCARLAAHHRGQVHVGVERPRDGERGGPEASRSEHAQRAARGDLGQRERVVAGGRRVGEQSRRGRLEPVCGEHARGGPHDDLGETTRVVHAEGPQRVAPLVLSADARLALPARRQRVQDREVALLHARAVAVNVLDDPCDLVPGPQRIGGASGQHHPVQQVQVGGADAAGQHADARKPGRGLGLGAVAQPGCAELHLRVAHLVASGGVGFAHSVSSG